MQILLLGKNGQLGWELHRCLAPLGQVVAMDQAEVNLAAGDRLREAVRALRPHVIVNAAAYTAVDRAESEPALAEAVNAVAPGILAEEAVRLGAGLIHFSTDYVFDGETDRPYRESDPPNPINQYGRSKLEGERLIEQAGCIHLTIRTSWVYSLRRPSFPRRVLEWARTEPVLRVVDDQTGSPTWCRTLASATALALARGAPDVAGWLAPRSGIYHLAGEGQASRLEWARRLLEFDPLAEEHVFESIQPAKSAEFPTPATRPAFSALSSDRFEETFGIRLPPWTESLKLALGENSQTP